jgi:DNA-binding MarR family transcriptional regulator
MKDERILDLLYYAHQYLKGLESFPRDYGTGEDLFSSDIHIVTAIADNPGINLTQLADKMNISKAAVSKFTSKMIQRGYVNKDRSGNNQKEVLFHVTEKGKIAVIGHEDFESKTFGPLLRIENELPAESKKIIVSYLNDLKKVIETKS